MTARENIIALAETESQRRLIARWLSADEEFTSRQRAWEELDRRRGEVRFRW